MPVYLQYFLIFIVSTVGSAIQAASGFGYGIFVMSVLPFFLPYGDALCATGLIAVFMAGTIAYKHRDAFDLKLIVYPVLFNLMASTAGTFFLKGQTDAMLKRVLGGFLVALSLYLFCLNDRVKIKATPLSGALSGGLGGIMGSMFGMGGPPIVIYLLSATSQTAAYIANLQVYFVCTNVYVAAIRYLHGMMNMQVLVYTGCGILGIYGGAKLGDLLFRRLDVKSLRRMVYVFMVAMGALLLIRG